MHTDSEIKPPRGKQKRLYAQAVTLREAAERLLESAEGKGIRLPGQFNDKDLWRPE